MREKSGSMMMVTGVKVLDGHRLELAFSDGTRGVVDLGDLAGKGVFAPWTDPAFFRKVAIGESGELVWPGGIDLCPDALYLEVTGKKPEDLFPILKRLPAHA